MNVVNGGLGAMGREIHVPKGTMHRAAILLAGVAVAHGRNERWGEEGLVPFSIFDT